MYSLTYAQINQQRLEALNTWSIGVQPLFRSLGLPLSYTYLRQRTEELGLKINIAKKEGNGRIKKERRRRRTTSITHKKELGRDI